MPIDRHNYINNSYPYTYCNCQNYQLYDYDSNNIYQLVLDQNCTRWDSYDSDYQYKNNVNQNTLYYDPTHTVNKQNQIYNENQNNLNYDNTHTINHQNPIYTDNQQNERYNENQNKSCCNLNNSQLVSSTDITKSIINSYSSYIFLKTINLDDKIKISIIPHILENERGRVNTHGNLVYNSNNKLDNKDIYIQLESLDQINLINLNINISDEKGLKKEYSQILTIFLNDCSKFKYKIDDYNIIFKIISKNKYITNQKNVEEYYLIISNSSEDHKLMNETLPNINQNKYEYTIEILSNILKHNRIYDANILNHSEETISLKKSNVAIKKERDLNRETMIDDSDNTKDNDDRYDLNDTNNTVDTNDISEKKKNNEVILEIINTFNGINLIVGKENYKTIDNFIRELNLNNIIGNILKNSLLKIKDKQISISLFGSDNILLDLSPILKKRIEQLLSDHKTEIKDIFSYIFSLEYLENILVNNFNINELIENINHFLVDTPNNYLTYCIIEYLHMSKCNFEISFNQIYRSILNIKEVKDIIINGLEISIPFYGDEVKKILSWTCNYKIFSSLYSETKVLYIIFYYSILFINLGDKNKDADVLLSEKVINLDLIKNGLYNYFITLYNLLNKNDIKEINKLKLNVINNSLNLITILEYLSNNFIEKNQKLEDFHFEMNFLSIDKLVKIESSKSNKIESYYDYFKDILKQKLNSKLVKSIQDIQYQNILKYKDLKLEDDTSKSNTIHEIIILLYFNLLKYIFLNIPHKSE